MGMLATGEKFMAYMFLRSGTVLFPDLWGAHSFPHKAHVCGNVYETHIFLSMSLDELTTRRRNTL